MPRGVKGEAWCAAVALPGPSRWAGGSFKVYAYNPDELKGNRLESSLSERVRSLRDLSLRVNLDSVGPQCPRGGRCDPQNRSLVHVNRERSDLS